MYDTSETLLLLLRCIGMGCAGGGMGVYDILLH